MCTSKLTSQSIQLPTSSRENFVECETENPFAIANVCMYVHTCVKVLKWDDGILCDHHKRSKHIFTRVKYKTRLRVSL